MDCIHTESSEVDSNCDAWCHKAYGDKCGHEFLSVEEQIHNRPPHLVGPQADLYIAGASCQPWSQMRWKGGETKSTSKPSEHPHFKHMTEDTPTYTG